ncbi:Barwin-like endoglucanase [Haematococcus lacustris]|uniref:Barwin-like endoglucanase n=1 Tax=Haematococcus lacustris TaxID=44745 RepID=A0A699ZLG1_HAELA|nr:Barwin-like endoglucanase [Haematococcus lacustris]
MPRPVPVSPAWLQVACRPPGNMRLRIVELRRTDGGYIKLVINNVNGFGQLVAVELARAGLQDSNQFGFPVSGEIWRRCDNTVGAYWEYSGLPANGVALDMRITDATGQVVNIRSAIPANATAGDFPLNGQFR